MLHDIERARFLKTSPAGSGKNVFVTGLARSGSAILVRGLHATGQFGSLTRADMPFVLAPNTWARLPFRRDGRAGRAGRVPGAQGGGAGPDRSLPGDFEEVFWRMADGRAYIRRDHLAPHSPDAAAMAAYRDFIRLVLRRTGMSRYLAENTNSILRLAPLAKAFPMSDILIPVRDPLQHAQSLLEAHLRFLDADAFTRTRMTWLVRHGFGAAHRPFRLAGEVGGDPRTLDYWLARWIEAHRAMLAVEGTLANIRFVPSEAIHTDPVLWRMIARRLEIPAAPPEEIRSAKADSGCGHEPRAHESRTLAPRPHDPGLAREAQAVFGRLTERSKLKFG